MRTILLITGVVGLVMIFSALVGIWFVLLDKPMGRDGQEPELPEDEEKDEARRAPAP
jgi:hypothetical protein